MSVDHHVGLICNNHEHIVFNDKDDASCFFHLQLNTYKKCIALLKTFKSIVNDLLLKRFSIIDNDTRVKEIINSSVSILYSNMLSLFMAQYKTNALFNLSVTNKSVKNYKVSVSYSKHKMQQVFSYKINSLRFQINTLDNAIIKIIHNDMCNIPESVIFIGKKSNDSIDDMLENYKLSIDIAIDKLKVHEYTFTCLLNNFTQATK